MKKAWMLLLVVFLIGVVSAQSIIFSQPNSVISGQIFQINVSLINFSIDIHNVKIAITNLTDSSDRLSELWNGTAWQSSCMSSGCDYFKAAFDTSISNSSSFLLNITRNYNGTGNITIRVDSTTYTFSNYLINITPAPPPTCTQSWTCTNSSCIGGWINQTCQNISSSCANINTSYNINCSASSSPTVSLDLDWNEEDVINGNEFNITVSADNLEDKDYDIMVWIVDDNGNVISQRYGNYSNSDIKWTSGDYWVYSLFPDNDDDSKKVTLRIKTDYSDFKGDATIFAKIREHGKTSEIDNIQKTITILASADNTTSSSTSDSTVTTDDTNTQALLNQNSNDDIIVLGSSSKTAEKPANGIIYKSKMEYIKDYAPYALCAVCIFIIIILMIEKRTKSKSRKNV